jgi:hypothetical protein
MLLWVLLLWVLLLEDEGRKFAEVGGYLYWLGEASYSLTDSLTD